MMAGDEELGRRCAAQSVSRKVLESLSRLGFTKVRTLYCVAFEASDRDEHVIEVAVRFALAGRSTLLTVDGEPVVKKSGRGLFEYGWARRGHAYVLREARAARPDDSDVFELLVDDKTYKNGRDAGAKGDLADTTASRNEDQKSPSCFFGQGSAVSYISIKARNVLTNLFLLFRINSDSAFLCIVPFDSVLTVWRLLA